MTDIKENGIKHCYRAHKGNTLLEPSLKALFIKFGWGATFKSQRMDVIYHSLLCLSYTSNYVQFFNLKAAILIFFSLKWDHYFIFGFLCLIKPDSDRISTLESFISQKIGYYTVYVSHLGFLSPASI